MSKDLSIHKSDTGISIFVDGPKSLVILKANLFGNIEYSALVLNKARSIDYPSDMFRFGELSGVIFPCPPTLTEDFIYYYNRGGPDPGIYGYNHVDPGKYVLGVDHGAWKLPRK